MKSFLFVVFFYFTLLAQENYELGHGYELKESLLYVGGYISADYRKMDEQSRVRIDDIAFLAYGRKDNFSYMLELEFKELYKRIKDKGVVTTTEDHKLYVEKVYLDYRIDDTHVARLGKFNSPIGFWNLVPVNVLRETTSNPYTSQILFPRFTTGLTFKASYFKESLLEFDVLVQHNASIAHEYNNYEQNRHYGLGVLHEKGDISIKLNGGYFKEEMQRDESYSYLLLSAKYESDSFQVQAESGAQKYSNLKNYASYLQGLYRFNENHAGVLRVESYKDARSKISDSMGILGYVYRPTYPVSFKIEYQQHKRNIQNQVMVSFSVLF